MCLDLVILDGAECRLDVHPVRFVPHDLPPITCARRTARRRSSPRLGDTRAGCTASAAGRIVDAVGEAHWYGTNETGCIGPARLPRRLRTRTRVRARASFVFIHTFERTLFARKHGRAPEAMATPTRADDVIVFATNWPRPLS
jgi:hypothetical protein